jgi:hypothetical protein
MAKVTVQKIQNLNTLVIKQQEGRFFISTQDSIVISVPCFAYLLKFLIQNNYISKKIVEGILQEIDAE